MNFHTRSMMVVMRKELRDFYRDRRTFLMTLLLTPLLFPAIMLGMFKLMENRASTQLDKDMTIPVAGSEFAPNLLAHLASHGIAARKASVAAMSGRRSNGTMRHVRSSVAMRVVVGGGTWATVRAPLAATPDGGSAGAEDGARTTAGDAGASTARTPNPSSAQRMLPMPSTRTRGAMEA